LNLYSVLAFIVGADIIRPYLPVRQAGDRRESASLWFAEG